MPHLSAACQARMKPVERSFTTMPATDDRLPARRLPLATLPPLGPKEPPRADPIDTADAIEGQRSEMFGQLVKDADDLVGMVAYGLYKLARRDWSEAFMARHRRAPDAVELNSFILGEQTPRRIESYRLLAETKLQLSPASANAPSAATPAGPVAAPKPEIRGAMIRLAILALTVVVAGLLIRFLYVRPNVARSCALPR